MKALSPARPARRCCEAVCCLSEQSLGIARGGAGEKSPAPEEPLSLLYAMNDCYSRLRELVPGIPRGSQLSQVEILQRVIDYIFDLQIVLQQQQQPAAPRPEPPAGAALLSLKAAGLASELCSQDERNLCH